MFGCQGVSWTASTPGRNRACIRRMRSLDMAYSARPASAPQRTRGRRLTTEAQRHREDHRARQREGQRQATLLTSSCSSSYPPFVFLCVFLCVSVPLWLVFFSVDSVVSSGSS